MAGTLTTDVNRPPELVAASPEVRARASVFHLKLTNWLPGKLAPIIVTWVPAAPEVALRVIDGEAVTVKVPVETMVVGAVE